MHVYEAQIWCLEYYPSLAWDRSPVSAVFSLKFHQRPLFVVELEQC